MKFLSGITGALLACILWINAASAQQQLFTEDVVYLKSGAVLRGMIVSRMPNPRVKVVTREGNVFIYPMEDVQRIAKESVRIRRSKNPATALTLSLTLGLVADGSGQWYNGDVKKGFMFFGWSVMSGIMIWRGVEDNFRAPEGLNNGVPSDQISKGENFDRDGDDAFIYLGLLGRAVGYGLAMFDARRSAGRKMQYAGATPPPSPQFGMRIVPALTPERRGMLVLATSTF